MSFTGDLEHLSIVDVVQLLHATRKSGTLAVRGRKGTAQLVFSDGFIVSANHFDERLKIGAILVEAGVLSREELAKALAEQGAAGDRRRPLIATLLESGRVRKEDAFRGLETLIELTIVDILTWKTGSFTLDVGAVAIADEYRYFPEKLHEDLHFHTENVLMEALRIYDEKKRDRRLPGSEPAGGSGEEGAGEILSLGEEAELSLSPDDLGLGEVDLLERRIPGVFSALDDRPAVSLHRGAIREAAPDLPEAEREELAAFLDGLAKRPPSAPPGRPAAVILLGADPLLAHCLTAVCRHEGFAVLTTTDPDDVGPVADQHRGKGLVPVLVLDREGLERAGLQAPRLPHLGTFELAAAPAPLPDDGGVVRAFLARPARGRGGPFVPALARFLEGFPAAVQRHAAEQGAAAAAAAQRCAARLRDAADAPAVVQAVLASVAELGARSLAFAVRGAELTSVRGAGVHLPGRDPAPAPALRVPLAQAPLARQAVESGRCLVAPAADAALRGALDAALGAPADPATLLVPLAASGRTVSLVYADFGAAPAAPPPVELLGAFAAAAGTALELALCRRAAARPAP